jgi:hypothetical protein
MTVAPESDTSTAAAGRVQRASLAMSRKVTLTLGVGVVLLTVMGAASVASLRRLVHSADWVAHTHDTRAALAAVRAGLAQSEAAALHAALAAQLARHGFSVVGAGEGAGYRLKPAVLLLEVTPSGTGLRVEVKASVIAIDGQGRIAAMVEGGARARTASAGAASQQLAAQALDAAARNISEDLARRLLENP